LTDLSQILIGELKRTSAGMIIDWFKNCRLIGLTSQKIVYRQSWVPKPLKITK